MRRRLMTLVALCALPGLAWSQSRGEVARKEKERRGSEQNGARPRVYTNEDLAKTPGKLANDPGLAAETGNTAPGASGISVEDGWPGADVTGSAPSGSRGGRQSEEQSWRSRARALRERIRHLEELVDRLDRWATWTAYGNSHPLITDQQFAGHRARVLWDLQQARSDLASARKALEDLEENARRQSIPPGWLRE